MDGTAIGIDAGGTRMRAARIDREGRILARTVEPVARDRKGFAAQLLRLIGEMQDGSARRAGIGIPGRVDGLSGEIRSAGYLDIAGLDIGGLIGGRAGLPARVENDATMALVGEAALRPDTGAGLTLMLTIGTGIGGGILLDGAPFHGGGVAGQFGHLVVARDGPRCKCGRTGCVETFSSGTALGGLMNEAGYPESARFDDLFALASTGDAMAAEVLRLWAQPLRSALETLAAALDPDLIVIGGGLGAQMVQALSMLEARDGWFALRVEAALLGDDAGVIGAGLCAFGLAGTGRKQAG